MKEARIRIGIEARDRGVVAAGHLAVLAIELAAEFDRAETARKPAAHRLIDPGQGRDLVGEPRRRLGIGQALDQIAQEFALRVAFDIGHVCARDRALGLARYRSHGR